MAGDWLTSCDLNGLELGCTFDDTRTFAYPTYIAVDSDDNVFAVDIWTKTVQKLTSDEEFIEKWGTIGM